MREIRSCATGVFALFLQAVRNLIGKVHGETKLLSYSDIKSLYSFRKFYRTSF